MGASHPGPVKSIDFKGFQDPTDAETPPPGKNLSPPGQIAEYAPG